MKAKWLNIRLFLEGIEVPVVSAVTTSVPDTPLSCQVQIPPMDEIKDLIERTLAHLFYYDPQPEDVTEWDSWHLLLVGEVTGYQIHKTPVQRAAVLQLMGLSNYWDVTYLFNDTGLGKTGRQLANFAGANTSVTKSKSNIFTGPVTGFSRLAKLINSKPASFSQMKGLLGGIVHVLEQIGGFYRGTRVFKGFNEFTSIAELRLKIMQQIHAASNDSTSAKLVSRPRLKKWVKNSIAGRGSMESFNGVIKKLMDLVYHDRQSIPAPPYFPGKETRKKKTYYTTKGVSSLSLVNDIESFIQEMEGIVGLTLGNWRTSINKAVNGYSKLAKRSARLAEEAKKKGSPDQSPKFLQGAKWLRRAASHSRESRDDLTTAAKTADSLYMRNMLATSQYLWTPIAYARKAVVAVKGLRTTSRKKSKTVVEVEYERLGVHVFKPDVFFAPPPCCNVLFPELYHSFEFARNYLAEPTRLMLRGGGGRKKSIFSGGSTKYSVYFAPDIPSVHRSIKLSSNKFVGEILPHEIYSGIIPTQVQIPWAKVYQISIKGKKKYPYIQRLANWEYFKRHFGSRNATVVGPFNPHFLPGFPALVIDRPLEEYKLLQGYEASLKDIQGGKALGAGQKFKTRAEFLDFLVPTQYIGHAPQVTHSINQQEGMTSYNLTLVREHRETGQKLGIATTETQTRYRSGRRSSLVMLDDVFNIKELRYGPHGGKVLSAKRLPDTLLKNGGKIFWMPTSGDLKKGSWKRHRWTDQDASQWWLKQESGQDRAKAYRVVEQISLGSKKVTKEIPLESSLTPPWLASLWHMSDIGSTYQSMFGCGAISDEIGVIAESTLSAARRHDRSLGDTVHAQRDANPYDDDLPVPNKDTDTFDYSAYDNDHPGISNPYQD